ncbi:Uncharacterised protein [Mycobacteroides abscessus subsp. abscessus]|nr:Uncharacterised protein [Mycobacteroides abscessus subsp. abscessus]
MGSAGSSSTSGAPITQLPCSPYEAPLHFLADEKGAIAAVSHPGGVS